MNIGPLVSWAAEMLNVLDGRAQCLYKGKVFTAQHRAKVEWLFDLRPMIMELKRTMDLMEIIMRALKAEGISAINVEWAMERLGTSAARRGINPIIYADMKRYLREQLAKCIELNREVVICSTDIAESYFGTYKEGIGKSAQSCFYCLRIVLYGESKYNIQEVQQAMEAARIVDLKEWRHNVLCQRMPSRKKQVAADVGRT